MTNSREEERTAPATSTRYVLELIALVVAPATLLGALLYYFGWARSRAQAAYFGIDSDVIGRSANEYALRSVGSIFWPVVMLLAGVLAALWIHAMARRSFAADRNGPLLWLLAACTALAGASLLAIAFAAVLWRPIVGNSVVTPVAFAVGIVALAYAVFVVSHRQSFGLAPVPRAPFALVVGLVVVFVFWAMGEYADARGTRLARRTAANLDSLPGVIIYSPMRLHLKGPGVTETRLAGADSAYAYRYAGLRLLAWSGSKYFLLPACWSRDQSGVAIVLPDSDSRRLEFTPAGTQRQSSQREPSHCP